MAAGLSPDLLGCWGSFSAPPAPVAAIGEGSYSPTSKGKGGKGRGREREGGERKWEGWDRESSSENKF